MRKLERGIELGLSMFPLAVFLLFGVALLMVPTLFWLLFWIWIQRLKVVSMIGAGLMILALIIFALVKYRRREAVVLI